MTGKSDLVDQKSLAISTIPSLKNLRSLEIQVRPAYTQIRQIASVLPPHRYAQRDMLEILGYVGNLAAEQIFERSTVKERYFCTPAERFVTAHDPLEQYQIASEGALSLAERAIQQLVETDASALNDVGCLLVTSSAALQFPGLASRLVERMNLPRSLAKYDLVGAGCLGALSTLALTNDYAKANPTKRILAVCVEIGSSLVRRSPPDDKEAMVVNSLFADGAVALVLGQGPPQSSMPELADILFLQGENMLVGATMAMNDDGLRIAHLHRQLPSWSQGLFATALDNLLEKNKLAREHIRHWTFHPGGRAIIDHLQSGLGLSDGQMEASRFALTNYGNASSPTCLLAFQRMLQTACPEPGDWGILGAVGPGLTVGLALVQWPEA